MVKTCPYKHALRGKGRRGVSGGVLAAGARSARCGEEKVRTFLVEPCILNGTCTPETMSDWQYHLERRAVQTHAARSHANKLTNSAVIHGVATSHRCAAAQRDAGLSAATGPPLAPAFATRAPHHLFRAT
eukprot:357397-Chlamydomonas_euryale.AAC.4